MDDTTSMAFFVLQNKVFVIAAAGAAHTLTNVMAQYTVHSPLFPPEWARAEISVKFPVEFTHYQSVRS